MKKFLTTSDVAQICGVAHTTVIRWITEGKLKAHETPGGHRRIDQSDLAFFMKQFNMPVPGSLRDGRFRILAVDDEKPVLSMLRRMFSQYLDEIDFYATPNCMEALVLMGRSSFDLLILDVGMPDMDGIQVCKTIKSNPDTAGIRIMVITGKELSEEQDEFLKSNAEAVIKKPFSPAVLMEKVRALM